MSAAPLAPTPTENYRRQHLDLLELAMQIGQRLTLEELARSAGEVRRQVAQFGGKLVVHARMENEAFYPRLQAHYDPHVREQATALFAEVGAIYDSFQAYQAAWPSAASIEASPAEFIKQTGRMFRLLGKRMMREEAELYPLVDATERA